MAFWRGYRGMCGFVLGALCLALMAASIGMAGEDAVLIRKGYGVSTASNHIPVGKGPVLLRMGERLFDPLIREKAQKSLAQGPPQPLEGAPGEAQGRYLIVQFSGPIQPSDRQALEDAGAEIFDYVPDFAFIVRMDPGQQPALRAITGVRWVGAYLPEYRRHARLEAELIQKGSAEAQLVITVFPGEDLARIRAAISSLGASIKDETTSRRKSKLLVIAPTSAIAAISAIEGVKWVERAPVWKLLNNLSTEIMEARAPRDSNLLYGQGQTLCVADTGLDQGSTAPELLHDDFEDGAGNSRVIQIIDRVGDGGEDHHGHGTHVAGSVLGNGFCSGSNPVANSFPFTSFAGSAPKASLIFQAIGNDLGNLLGIPLDLGIMFEECQTAGPGSHIHTNSWGSSDGSQYTSFSQDVDEYVWDHKDYLILFAAGNEGSDRDTDGAIDWHSLDSPATAKNCVSVGATEGYRASGSGAPNFAYGSFWSEDYPVDPIFSDHVSNNAGGMAAFSSRGPCLDGRIKPDVVAPGTNILSTKSSLAPEGNFWGPYNTYYAWMGGTSMATPLTAGIAALIRQYLVNDKGLTNPSAALLKASLINAAQDISPGQYGTGSTQEIPEPPVPNPVEGWGLVNLENAVYPTGGRNILHYDESHGLSTGGSMDYPISVNGSGSPLKVNLVWSDYPGTPVAAGGLVNDLDLTVTDPDGITHYPDHASQKDQVDALVYDADWPLYYSPDNRVATKFTPSSYPATVEAVSFLFYNPHGFLDDVDLVIYDDNGSGGLPGTELFRKTIGFVGDLTWITVQVEGVSVPSGSFYGAVEKSKSQSDFGVIVDNINTGKGYRHDGSAWVLSGKTPYIRAFVRGADLSTPNDRVNNAEGITISSPSTGPWIVTVSAYNVPHGPQPYALVVSGDVRMHSGISVMPDKGGPGATVTLNGYNFGAKKPKIYFTRGLLRQKAPISSYSDTQIVCNFPKKKLYEAGPYSLEVTNKVTKLTQTLTNGFELMNPELSAASSYNVTRGDTILLTGQYFGTKKGKVWFEGPGMDPKKAGVTQWTDTQITCTVPKKLPTGDYTVRVENKVGWSRPLALHITSP